MGPGFVPRALTWGILGFGVVFVGTSVLKPPSPIPLPAWRPLATILASIALFAVLLSTFGLIAACIGTVLVAGAATAPIRWLELAVCSLVIAAFSGLLFVKGLGLPFRLWPW